MSELVLLRHGQSQWNLRNLFTGWVDVDLTPLGEQEAAEAGRLMAEEGLGFDVVYTSVLTRAVRTAELALSQMGQSWRPVIRHWRMNERHYGSLQGLDKAETARRYGADQVKVWRRSYSTPPPELEPGSDMHPSRDARYRDVPPDQLPATECLADVVARFLPYWHEVVAPDLLAGRRVLMVAHGNSLRALMKHLDGFSDDEIVALEVATGVPRLYDLDDADPCSVRQARWLGDPDEVAGRAAAVAAQADGSAPPLAP